jgi:Uma2 family endonuclease
MTTSTLAPLVDQRLVLSGSDWRTYTRLLRALERHPAVRLTYDRGVLEVMTLSHEHEGLSYILGRFVDVLTEELGLPIKGGRSTTFRRRKRRKGLEPDNCFWIANETRVRGKTRINLKTDPPPDLAIEVDVSHSSLDRLGIYAALGVPEVWRYDGQALTFHVLAGTAYTAASHSPTFPFLAPADVLRFLALRASRDENEVARAFRAWVRQQLPPQP